MKLRYFVAFSTAMIASAESQAAYVGLGVKLHATVMQTGVLRDVWRVYAVFDHPDDMVTAVGGSEANGPATVQNLNADGSGFGTGFFNSGGSTPPDLYYSFATPAQQYDTFVAIGLASDDINNSDDDVGVSPGFHLFTPGQNTTQWGPFNNDAWFILPVQEQGKAGNGVAGPFLNNGADVEGMGVLIMQLTVNAGQHVAGTVFVNGEIGGALAGQTYTVTNQTFSSIPAPGAAAVLGLTGVIGASRRRRAGPQMTQMAQV